MSRPVVAVSMVPPTVVADAKALAVMKKSTEIKNNLGTASPVLLVESQFQFSLKIFNVHPELTKYLTRR